MRDLHFALIYEVEGSDRNTKTVQVSTTHLPTISTTAPGNLVPEAPEVANFNEEPQINVQAAVDDNAVFESRDDANVQEVKESDGDTCPKGVRFLFLGLISRRSEKRSPIL